MAETKASTRDRLGWLLRLPVILIWLDAGGRALRWRLSSISEAALLLQSGSAQIEDGKERI